MRIFLKTLLYIAISWAVYALIPSQEENGRGTILLILFCFVQSFFLFAYLMYKELPISSGRSFVLCVLLNFASVVFSTYFSLIVLYDFLETFNPDLYDTMSDRDGFNDASPNDLFLMTTFLPLFFLSNWGSIVLTKWILNKKVKIEI